MRVLSMFIASPGGVEHERDAVEAVVGRLNASLGRIHQTVVTARRFEQLVGGAGNPQTQINAHADDSDIFVGIIHRRWGSETGNGFDSGFHEEFTRALRRWQVTRSPRIALFFKDVDSESLDDPGDQLRKVLDFKQTVETEHLAFYSRFSTAAELEGMVTSLVAEELANVAQSKRTPEGEGASAADASVERRPEAREPISVELSAVVQAFGGALAGQEVDSALDFDRFELFALSVSRDSDRVPTHLANRLYSRRKDLALIRAELIIWFREYLRDIGRSTTAENRVIPFAAVVGREWIAAELDKTADEYLKDEDSDLRLGTIRLMRSLRVRPKNVWPRAVNTVEVAELQAVWNLLAGSSEKAEVVRYWLAVSEKRDVRIAGAIANLSGPLGEMGRALGGLLQDEPDASWLAEIDVRLLTDPAVRKCFGHGAPERTLTDVELARLAGRSYVSEDVRALALTELANRDLVPNTVLKDVFNSKSLSKWSRTVDRILLDREVGPNFLQAAIASLTSAATDEGAHEKRRRTGDVVAILARRNETLDQAFTAIVGQFDRFNDNVLSWRLIRLHGDTSAEAFALAILNKTDPGYRVFIESMDAAGWNQETKSYLQDRVDLSVLTYLLSLRGATTDSSVARRIRSLARDDTSIFHRDAIQLLATIAQDIDIDLLIDNIYSFDDPDATMAEVLKRSSLKRLRALALGDDERLACLALEELSRRDRVLTISKLKQLLRSPIASVRMIALEQAVRGLEIVELEEFGTEYVRGKGMHYYNVLCSIDDRLVDMPTCSARDV